MFTLPRSIFSSNRVLNCARRIRVRVSVQRRRAPCSPFASPNYSLRAADQSPRVVITDDGRPKRRSPPSPSTPHRGHLLLLRPWQVPRGRRPTRHLPLWNQVLCQDCVSIIFFWKIFLFFAQLFLFCFWHNFFRSDDSRQFSCESNCPWQGCRNEPFWPSKTVSFPF